MTPGTRIIVAIAATLIFALSGGVTLGFLAFAAALCLVSTLHLLTAIPTLSWGLPQCNSPNEYVQRLTIECNYLNAVKQVDLDQFITENCVTIDLGCGGGWLSAYVSRFKRIKTIFAIDTSLNYLSNFVPEVTKIMEGDITKIETVRGHFYPLLLEDKSIDLILVSSAAHHANNLETLFKECRRVLRDSGYILILNETPSNELRFLLRSFKEFIRTIIFNHFRLYRAEAVTIGAGKVLYDPNLGDVDYAPWFWKKAISAANLNLIHIHNSKLPTVVDGKSYGHPLSHFICAKRL